MKRRQVLHLVFGGELEALDDITFKDAHRLDIVGVYPDLEEAEKAWRTKARDTIDNAQMRYFIVPLHKLLDPGKGKRR
jgi:Domain of unknown function (DUF4170)